MVDANDPELKPYTNVPTKSKGSAEESSTVSLTPVRLNDWVIHQFLR